MGKHNYNFNGGDLLSKIGASWLISYLYHSKIDKKHLNWERISKPSQRVKMCGKSVRYHKYWIEKIIKMNANNLSRNRIGLTGAKVIDMAKELLQSYVNGIVSQAVTTAKYKMHIVYRENIKIVELAELLRAVNLSINDYYRDNGISNRELNDYAAVVSKVESGSIWIEFIMSVFTNLTASLLKEYVLRRLDRNTKNNVGIHIETGDNCVINIYINNCRK